MRDELALVVDAANRIGSHANRSLPDDRSRLSFFLPSSGHEYRAVRETSFFVRHSIRQKRNETMTAHETTPSDAAKPFDLDPSRNRMRADFEHWYICHAFDYQRDPIGGEKCSLQWQAWKGAREIEQGRGAVAELPEPVLLGHDRMIEEIRGYTADQMTAYGEACRRRGKGDE